MSPKADKILYMRFFFLSVTWFKKSFVLKKTKKLLYK